MDERYPTKEIITPPPLRDFIYDGWHVIDPGVEIYRSWHIDAIADHLEAVSRHEIKLLAISIPPGHAKSIVATVMYPAWMWTWQPEWRGLFSSYAQELAIRDSVRCRDVIESEWYQSSFGSGWKLKGDQNVKSYFANTQQGFRLSLSVGGKATGFRGDVIVTDDPLNALERHSVRAREKVIDWWDRSMSSRLNDKRKGARIVIMQRLHEEDLIGHILRKGGYEYLMLPSLFEPDRATVTYHFIAGERREFYRDPRTTAGELLFSRLFPEPVLKEAKTDLGETDFAAQHQHRPAPAEGGMFKRWYWQYWHWPDHPLPPVKVKMPDGTFVEIAPVPLPKSFARQVQSWDMTFKDKKSSDYVVGQVWGAKSAHRYLLHQVREQMGFSDTVHAVKAVTKAFPLARGKFVEDKANGPAVIDHLKGEITGLIAVEPRGSKEARAWVVEPEIRSGNVFLPHPQIAAWVDGYISEFAAFPNGKDDQVDATSQALDQLANTALGGAYSS